MSKEKGFPIIDSDNVRHWCSGPDALTLGAGTGLTKDKGRLVGDATVSMGNFTDDVLGMDHTIPPCVYVANDAFPQANENPITGWNLIREFGSVDIGVASHKAWLTGSIAERRREWAIYPTQFCLTSQPDNFVSALYPRVEAAGPSSSVFALTQFCLSATSAASCYWGALSAREDPDYAYLSIYRRINNVDTLLSYDVHSGSFDFAILFFSAIQTSSYVNMSLWVTNFSCSIFSVGFKDSTVQRLTSNIYRGFMMDTPSMAFNTSVANWYTRLY